MTYTTYRKIKDIWRDFTEQGKINVTYRSFLYWFNKLGLDKGRLDETCVNRLELYSTLRNATTVKLFKNPQQKIALLTEIYTRFKTNENGVRVMNGKDFQELLIDKQFSSRTQLYEKCKAVGVEFSTSSPITLGDARKVITGISN